MRRKKDYKLKEGHYFFDIKNGYQSSIIISRKTKRDALRAYKLYIKQRKECNWLGKWDGKQFVEQQAVSA